MPRGKAGDQNGKSTDERAGRLSKWRFASEKTLVTPGTFIQNVVLSLAGTEYLTCLLRPIHLSTCPGPYDQPRTGNRGSFFPPPGLVALAPITIPVTGPPGKLSAPKKETSQRNPQAKNQGN